MVDLDGNGVLTHPEFVTFLRDSGLSEEAALHCADNLLGSTEEARRKEVDRDEFVRRLAHEKVRPLHVSC